LSREYERVTVSRLTWIPRSSLIVNNVDAETSDADCANYRDHKELFHPHLGLLLACQFGTPFNEKHSCHEEYIVSQNLLDV